MLEVRGLTVRLGDFSLSDISFEVASGEYFVLLGASGMGKTVLLETLTGIVAPDSGRIVMNGVDITAERIQNRKIAIVFQDLALFPHMSVRENISYGLSKRRIKRRTVDEKVNELADYMGIRPLLDRMPGSLSGGEAQRVALARALAREPECILLDEPLSSLDYSTRTRIRGLLRRLNRAGITVIHVTHDYEEAISLAERIGVIENGSIVQIDSPDKILHDPKSEFVAAFVGIKNFLKGKLVREMNNSGGSTRFLAAGKSLSVESDSPGGDCCAVIRSEDISISRVRPSSGKDNILKGKVTDICRVRHGLEIVVDADMELSAVTSEDFQERTGIGIGSEVYLSFKPGAVRILEVQ